MTIKSDNRVWSSLRVWPASSDFEPKHFTPENRCSECIGCVRLNKIIAHVKCKQRSQWIFDTLVCRMCVFSGNSGFLLKKCNTYVLVYSKNRNWKCICAVIVTSLQQSIGLLHSTTHSTKVNKPSDENVDFVKAQLQSIYVNISGLLFTCTTDFIICN